MTHYPCRHSCCIPPTAREAVERQRASMVRRKRDLLDQIKEAHAWGRVFILPHTDVEVVNELIGDGLVYRTIDGFKPHP